MRHWRLAPGLGEVRTLVARAGAAWLVLAVALEVASSLSYVAMFRPVFCRRMGWPRARRSLVELAVGSIVPASGAGGIALGAWILSRYGMPGEVIARRSVAFLLIKSSVNFIAVAVLGVLMFLGVGPHRSAALTLLPAALAVAAIAGVVLVARVTVGAAGGGSGRLRKALGRSRRGCSRPGGCCGRAIRF